jgi:hypothetical protein
VVFSPGPRLFGAVHESVKEVLCTGEQRESESAWTYCDVVPAPRSAHVIVTVMLTRLAVPVPSGVRSPLDTVTLSVR